MVLYCLACGFPRSKECSNQFLGKLVRAVRCGAAPALNKFYQSNHTASSDFEILAISVDSDTAAATHFAIAQKLIFPVLLDPSQRVARAYEEKGLPTMFIIDKSGKITYGHLGHDSSMNLARELGIDERSIERKP